MAIPKIAIAAMAAVALLGGGLYAGGVFTKSKDSAGVGLEISDNETTLNEIENNKDNQNQKIKKAGKEGSSMKDELSKGTYSNKFGGKYAYFFLSTEDGVNEKTWAARAASIQKDTALASGSFFDELKYKPENEKVKALKDKCIEIYKEGDEYKSSSFASKWREVWKYCSIFDEKPLTIYYTSSTDTSEDRKYASGSQKYGNKLMGDLVSTYSEKNNKFWELRQEEFKAGTLGEGTTSTYFNKDGTEDIRTLCQKAYEQTKPSGNADTANAPSEANIKKYCAID